MDSVIQSLSGFLAANLSVDGLSVDVCPRGGVDFDRVNMVLCYVMSTPQIVNVTFVVRESDSSLLRSLATELNSKNRELSELHQPGNLKYLVIVHRYSVGDSFRVVLSRKQFSAGTQPEEINLLD